MITIVKTPGSQMGSSAAAEGDGYLEQSEDVGEDLGTDLDIRVSEGDFVLVVR